ncbi:tail fiber domain-containing protein [Saprospiraceae bacterium]|nr:tail fiber domain-containing protein [Saprospiraceae bacterium]
MKHLTFFIITFLLSTYFCIGQGTVKKDKKSNNSILKTPSNAHVDIDLNGSFKPILAAKHASSTGESIFNIYNDLDYRIGVGITGSNNTNSIFGPSVSYLFTEGTDLAFASEIEEVMRLTTFGNVGIGTTSPETKLHALSEVPVALLNGVIRGEYFPPINTNSDQRGVEGVSNIDDWYGIGVNGIGGWRGVSGSVFPIDGDQSYYGLYGFINDGGSTATGTNYAVYGSATGNAVNYAGYFSGDATVTGTFNNPSDSKLKTDIISIGDNMLYRINALDVKEYKFKINEFSIMNLPEGKQSGFIAQEIQSVFPELVKKNVHPVEKKNADGKKISDNIEFLGVNYIGLIPILTKGLQELSAENEILKVNNKNLEVRIGKLEAAVSNLIKE